MKVEKYKYLGNSKYKVFINNSDYIMYEDIILKYNILTNDINLKELDLCLNDNRKYEAYYLSIKYIKIKLRTRKEINNYLLKNNCSKDEIDFVISKLEKDGYLNDVIYCKAYINDSINLKDAGPLKIRKDLISLGINVDVIDKELLIFDNELIIERINKKIEKSIKLNKNKSSFILKNKIKNDLVNLGYNVNDINNVLSNYDIDDSLIKKKEYNKLYDRLSKKYEGDLLELKVKQQLYQKGFR